MCHPPLSPDRTELGIQNSEEELVCSVHRELSGAPEAGSFRLPSREVPSESSFGDERQ